MFLVQPTISLMYHFQTYLNVQPKKLTEIEEIVDDDDDNIDTNVIKTDTSSVKNLEFICEVYGFV